MTPDVRELLRFLRVPDFRYREFHPLTPLASHASRQRTGFTILALVSLLPRTGRTTLAANLAVACARRGLRAAALDLDPRADLGAHFDRSPERDGDRPGSLVEWTSSGAGFVPFGRDPVLALESLAADCDAVFLDTKAGPSDAVEQAMAEADEVLIVVRPDAASCDSVGPTESLLSRARRSWRRTRARYLVNRFDGRRRSDREALATLRRSLGSRVFVAPVQEDEAVRAALASGRSISEEAPGSQVLADLDAITAELMPRPRGERVAGQRVRKAKAAR